MALMAKVAGEGFCSIFFGKNRRKRRHLACGKGSGEATLANEKDEQITSPQTTRDFYPQQKIFPQHYLPIRNFCLILLLIVNNKKW